MKRRVRLEPAQQAKLNQQRRAARLSALHFIESQAATPSDLENHFGVIDRSGKLQTFRTEDEMFDAAQRMVG